MDLNKLFDLITELLGDISTFQGLTFELPHGVLVIDFVEGREFEGDIVNGFQLDYLPFLDIEHPFSGFALDNEGLKYLLQEYVL
ncbi:hypothetical protein IAQ67_28520 (plasmid) [Paenibacillus peoriae]|uniref:Uncharacterized protein n=1 Tax=Paenibacillus peoriae TaxID=59893 RepID=A0A7H0YHA0_9BACL|nr:hypothetical protein [Paenibacillus peoriae]QNR70458.1 hypothetical protein IAQ67_28520 [Paenibacillus peoriae]